MIRSCRLIRWTLRFWCTCTTRSNNLTRCSTISFPRSGRKRASPLSTPSRRHQSTVPHQACCAASSRQLAIARSVSIGSPAATPISRFLRHRPLQAARDRKRSSRARCSSARAGQKLGSFDKSGRDSAAVTLKLVQSARRQHCKYDRHQNKRWHISQQMTALGRVAEGLNPHDRRVNHARPHGEPDEALVSVGISCGDEQKHAQRRVHSDDHHEIVRMSLSPGPARGPENTQCIYAKYESQTDDDQRHAQKKQTICIRHFASPKRHAYSSELRKVTWHLPFELGEVARDRGHVEASEDRFLGLAVEQEPEGRLDTAFWRMLACRQPLAHLSRHGDVVTSLALSFADDHIENKRVVRGSAPDVNHVDPLCDARVLNGSEPVANGTRYRLILDQQNDIVRRSPYTRLTPRPPRPYPSPRRTASRARARWPSCSGRLPCSSARSTHSGFCSGLPRQPMRGR